MLRRLIADMSALVEGKARAQRQAMQLMLQQPSEVAGRDPRPELVEQLDTLRQAAVMLGDENRRIQKVLAAEMSAFIDALSR